MTLAAEQDTQVDPSPIPLPGSPSGQPQNLNSNYPLEDKTETTPEDSVEIIEKCPASIIAQRSTEFDLDVEREIDPSRSRETTLASANHSRVNGASTAAGDIRMNGNPASDATHNAIRASPTPPPSTVSSTELHSRQQGMQQSAEDSSSQATNQGQLNGQADPPSGQSSLTLQSSTNCPPPANGNSASTIGASATSPTTPPAPSPSPATMTFNGLRTRISDDNNAMVIDDNQNASPDDPPSDNGGPPSRRTRLRQKRPPNPMSREPAKRARTSSDVSLDTIASLVSKANSDAGHGDDEDRTTDVEMRVSPHAEATVTGPSTVAAEDKGTQISSAAACDVSRPELPRASVPISIKTSSDSNLDPSLVPPPKVPQHPAESSRASSSSSESLTEDKAAKDNDQAKSTSPSTSSLANNPYFPLSTAFLKGPANSSATGYNPYALYYGPGTPISPHTPTYPYPYLYHLHSPISAQAMYPTSPSFTPSPTTQKAPPTPTPSTSEPQRQKPKRLKAHTVTSGNHNIPIVPRDKKGKPMLPLNVGIMTVIRLGEVCMREHFHTERYIFPVGYEVTRRYLSTMDPNAEVVYHCTILDGGDGPKFQIVPSDAPDRTVIAGTATGAWSSIVKQANTIRSRQHSNSVSGPDFFGLGQNTIKHLIQELPNADRLKDYVWQNFIEGGPLGGRHAAVTPALPEDYDSTLPIGALYPAERDRLKREAIANPRGLNYYPQHIIAQAEAQRKDQSGSQQIAQQESPPIPESVLSPLDTRVAGPNGHVGTSPISGQPPGPAPIVPNAVSSQPPTACAPPSLQGSPTSVTPTIASIMSAYPAPVATSTPASAPTSTSAPASASSSSS